MSEKCTDQRRKPQDVSCHIESYRLHAATGYDEDQRYIYITVIAMITDLQLGSQPGWGAIDHLGKVIQQGE